MTTTAATETQIATMVASLEWWDDRWVWKVRKDSLMRSMFDHINWEDKDVDNVDCEAEVGELLVLPIMVMPAASIKVLAAGGRLSNVSQDQVLPFALRHYMWAL